MTTTPSALADRLRAWAKGIYPVEAGVELLIRSGNGVYEGAPWINEEADYASIDVDRLVDEAGAWSGGEQRVVAIAASLLSTEHTVNLHECLPGLDRPLASLVLAAMAHAKGSHEDADVVFDADGRPRGFENQQTLYPWP